MQPEHSTGIFTVKSQGYFAICCDAKVVSCGHMTESNLLLPFYDITFDVKTKANMFYPKKYLIVSPNFVLLDLDSL